MPSRRVAAELNAGTYYLTLTVQRWYYLFDRYNRWQIMSDSIRYCQRVGCISEASYTTLELLPHT